MRPIAALRNGVGSLDRRDMSVKMNSSRPWWRRWLPRLFPIGVTVIGLFYAGLSIVVALNATQWAWLASTLKGYLVLGVPLLVGAVCAVITVRDADTVADLRETHATEKAQLQRDKAQLSDDIDNLKAENISLSEDNRALFESTLRHLAESLDFGWDERITVYEYAESGFAPIGRYSINPNLRSRGRKACPVDEGVIGLAWDGKPSFVDDLPDPHTKADEYYADVEERCRLPRVTCRSLKMKSRCLFGHCILDPLGDGPVAVIVFESLRPNRFTQAALTRAFQRDENRLKSYLAQRRTAPIRTNGRKEA